jgi:hypothetical protein
LKKATAKSDFIHGRFKSKLFNHKGGKRKQKDFGDEARLIPFFSFVVEIKSERKW